jgi:hypothetical protein
LILRTKYKRQLVVLAVLGLLAVAPAFAANLDGTVLGAGKPIAKSTVTLWAGWWLARSVGSGR